KYGVNTTDARQAMQQLCQDDMNLKDLQRSVGYSEANFGLALIRSSVGLQGQQRLDQKSQGQLLIDKASQDDPFMMGPPPDANFMKHFKQVMQIAEGGGTRPGYQRNDGTYNPGGAPYNPGGAPYNP